VFQLWDVYRDALNIERSEYVEGSVECDLDIRLERGEWRIGENSEPHSGDAVSQLRGVVDAVGGHRCERMGTIGHGCAEWTKVVKGDGQRLDPAEGHQSVRGFVSDHAAERSRNAN
jgi:hypothetical protein